MIFDGDKLNGLSNGDGLAGKPVVRRQHYLHRFGSQAVLMTVEWATAEDGSERKRVQYAQYLGL